MRVFRYVIAHVRAAFARHVPWPFALTSSTKDEGFEQGKGCSVTPEVN